jgi:hypothetical protein
MSTFPASLTESELFAVNEILASIGQAPVVNLSTANPDTALALNTLRSVNREIQAERWLFNFDEEYELTPDNNGNILVPANVLMVDVSRHLPENYGMSVVARDGKLYNRVDRTFVFGRPLKCDILWLINFSETPAVFQNYVTARAAVVASSRMLGDRTQFVLLKDREMSAKAACMEWECSNGNYNMLGFNLGRDYYTRYDPHNALIR